MRCVHTHSSLTILDALVRRTVPRRDEIWSENHVEIFVTRATGSKSPKDIANLSNHAAPAAPPAPLNYRDPL